MPERFDRAQIDIPGELVEISWDERDELLERLRIVTGDATIVGKFEAGGASRPVELDEEDCGRLRMALELWQATAIPDLPHRIASLLAALEQTERAHDTPPAA